MSVPAGVVGIQVTSDDDVVACWQGVHIEVCCASVAFLFADRARQVQVHDSYVLSCHCDSDVHAFSCVRVVSDVR